VGQQSTQGIELALGRARFLVTKFLATTALKFDCEKATCRFITEGNVLKEGIGLVQSRAITLLNFLSGSKQLSSTIKRIGANVRDTLWLGVGRSKSVFGVCIWSFVLHTGRSCEREGGALLEGHQELAPFL
jgi:hypothetical protein